jgi:hypothetical protein
VSTSYRDEQPEKKSGIFGTLGKGITSLAHAVVPTPKKDSVREEKKESRREEEEPVAPPADEVPEGSPEENRKVWFEYAVATDDYTLANELWVTPEEKAICDGLKTPAPAGEVDVEEARCAWLDYHIAEGEFGKAEEMCVGPEDFAKVSAAQDAARTEWRDYEMSCGNYKTAMSYSVTDEEIAECEQAMFKKECETGSYKRALKQAKTPEQVAEVEKYQEAGRVAWMEYHAACGDTSAALKYAVTDEEEEKCKQAGIDKCESNRKEWLAYYTEKGDYRKAEECCVEPAEYEAVAAKKEEAS